MEMLYPEVAAALKWLVFSFLLAIVVALSVPAALSNIFAALFHTRTRSRNTEYEDESSH